MRILLTYEDRTTDYVFAYTTSCITSIFVRIINVVQLLQLSMQILFNNHFPCQYCDGLKASQNWHILFFNTTHVCQNIFSFSSELKFQFWIYNALTYIYIYITFVVSLHHEVFQKQRQV